MNGKTARLLQRYALAKGISVKTLKQEWQQLDGSSRFRKRQELLQELIEKSGKKIPD